MINWQNTREDTCQLALDLFLVEKPIPVEDVERRVGLKLSSAPVLVTLHSETHGDMAPRALARLLIGALSKISGPIIITAPNADPGGREIAEELSAFSGTHGNVSYVESLGARIYRTVLERARFMIGNSSSGLIEAASFRLPVINIGERQAARLRPANVIDVPPEENALRDAIARAGSATFRAGLEGLSNPYGDGHASGRIVEVLRDVSLDSRLLVKRFQDWAGQR